MDSFTCTHCPFDRQTLPDISRFHFLSGKNIPRSSRPDPLPTTGTETPHPRTPKKDGFSTSCGRYRPHEPFFLSAFGKREAGSGKREAGSGKREAGSGKQEAGSRKQEAGSRKQEAGSRKQEAGSRKQEAGSRATSYPTVPRIPITAPEDCPVHSTVTKTAHRQENCPIPSTPCTDPEKLFIPSLSCHCVRPADKSLPLQGAGTLPCTGFFRIQVCAVIDGYPANPSRKCPPCQDISGKQTDVFPERTASGAFPASPGSFPPSCRLRPSQKPG